MRDKKIIIALVFLLVIGAVAFWIINSDSDETTDTASHIPDDNALMHEEYPSVPENNRYVREPYSDVIERFKTGTGIIFLGFKECSWCQKMAPILNEAAEAEGSSIYYLDINTLRINNPTAFSELATHLSPYLQKNEQGAPSITTPDISFVKDGEIVWRYEMDAVSAAERSPATYWTSARKERSIQTFREQIKRLE